MLNAYRGIASDRRPVAPEFWNYYPARVLGLPMIEFEREVPFWKSLQLTFEHYGCEGFGIVFPQSENPNIERRTRMDGYTEITDINHLGRHFQTRKVYDKAEPSWVTKRLISEPEELPAAADYLLDPQNHWDYETVNKAHAAVGESYLLEMWCGTPFFDFIAEAMGFEEAVMYFADEEEQTLLDLRRRFTDYQLQFVRDMAENTPFESYMIGCSYSCNSLIGKHMWRKWDKPYLQAMADELHRHGKLLHVHFHGRSIETVRDFAEIGIDCVCPFERAPGGDVNTEEDLRAVREKLQDRVTFNGNIHTVQTLIRGTPADARREVRQLKRAFEGSNRLIIGTGDQVGAETKEDVLLAMLEEGMKT